MLSKDDKELADRVFKAYKKAEEGTLRKWARLTFVQSGMKHEVWSTGFVGAMEATLLSVVCKMLKEGTFIRQVKEVK